jgi:hypothetical protein
MEREEAKGPRVGPPSSSTPLIVAAEKNLETIGYFSPATATLQALEKKRIQWRVQRTANGRKEEVEVSVTIDGTAIGLPTSTDLDFYTGYQCICAHYILRGLQIPYPLVFTTRDLFEAMGRPKGGDQYLEVRTWLERMQRTLIVSEGAVYDAGKQSWVVTERKSSSRSYQERMLKRQGGERELKKDRLNSLIVFSQYHQEGETVNGRRMDANIVYPAPWFRKNIEQQWTKPLSAGLYFKLRRPLAKVLFRVLDTMLYAGEGSCHKRYDDLCTLLGIAQFDQPSRIKQQLDGALKELSAVGFLRTWAYKRTHDRDGWILRWFAGEEWHRLQKFYASYEGRGASVLSSSSVELALPPEDARDQPGQLLLPLDDDRRGAGERESTKSDHGKAGAESPGTAPVSNSATQEVDRIIRHFHERQLGFYSGTPKTGDIETAEYLLAHYAPIEKVLFCVGYGCKKFPNAQLLKGIMDYIPDAAVLYDREQDRKQMASAVTAGPTIDELVEQRLAAIAPEVLAALEAKAIPKLESNVYLRDYFATLQPEECERARRECVRNEVKTLLRDAVLEDLRQKRSEG